MKAINTQLFLFRIQFDRGLAERTRDSVIKHIYTELFRAIIDKCNTGNKDSTESQYIAILDIPGFGM